LFVVTVTPNHLRVSCCLELQHVSIDVPRFQDKEEKLPPPYWFVVAMVWIFGGCCSGDTTTFTTKNVSLSWALLNP
jgi:hypothetical protein